MIIISFIIFLLFVLKDGSGQTLEVSGAPPSLWNILDKLAEKDDELANAPLSIGKKEVVYYENRYTILSGKTEAECVGKNNLWDEENGVCKVISRKRSTDRERTIGLKLLNTETGKITVVAVNTKITPDGVNIITSNNYQIETVEQFNGIKWNSWNTEYRVIYPENSVVIENYYPREVTEMVSRIVKGKVKKEPKKVVRGFPYIPYSKFFEQPENKEIFVAPGGEYLKTVVAKAFDTLEERGIYIDREVLSPRFFERLPLLEQGDFTEFQRNPQRTVNRVLTILGANKENAWRHTCNSADACGWIQFTTRTYKNIRTGHRAAMLTENFRDGAGDHLNSIMAAILLHKVNLEPLIKKFGPKMLNDPDLEKYLAASYNGAPKWVHNSLTATISKAFTGWVAVLSPTRKDSRGGLRKETRDFMAKLDYLIEHDLP